MFFELNGKFYSNNSAVSIFDIGEGEAALLCKTNKQDCCGAPPNRFGEFYYPNGVEVPIHRREHGFYRNRGDQVVRLNRRDGVTAPTGMYRCDIPDESGMFQKVFISLLRE